MIDVTWICPECQSEQADLFDKTACPLCDNCEKVFSWGEVLNAEQLQSANKQLKKATAPLTANERSVLNAARTAICYQDATPTRKRAITRLEGRGLLVVMYDSVSRKHWFYATHKGLQALLYKEII